MDKAIEALSGVTRKGGGARGRRTLSSAARERIAAAQRAKNAIARSLALAAKYHDRQVELYVAMTAAQVLASPDTANGRAAAISRLDQVHAEAAKAGFITYALEARLALGEVEILSGNRSSGSPTLNLCRKRPVIAASD